MKAVQGKKVILSVILCVCLLCLGYVMFKIKNPRVLENTKIEAVEEISQPLLHVVNPVPWPPFSTQLKIQRPLLSMNRVTVTSPLSTSKARMVFSDGQAVTAGDVIVQFESDEQREKLREAEKRYALIQATYDRASAIYAVTGSNAEILKALQDRLIEAENALMQARQAIAEREITAPISGVIDYHITPETQIVPQLPLATIYSTEHLNVEVEKEFFSKEQLINQKENTLPINIQGTETEIYHAPFSFDPIGNLILYVANTDGKYSIGMPVEINLEIFPRTQVLAIPNDAIREHNGKKYVWVKLRSSDPSQQLFIRREVQTSDTKKAYTAIIAGLVPFEEVLCEPPVQGSEEILRETIIIPLAASSKATKAQ